MTTTNKKKDHKGHTNKEAQEAGYLFFLSFPPFTGCLSLILRIFIFFPLAKLPTAIHPFFFLVLVPRYILKPLRLELFPLLLLFSNTGYL